jgi:hypothetical protein
MTEERRISKERSLVSCDIRYRIRSRYDLWILSSASRASYTLRSRSGYHSKGGSKGVVLQIPIPTHYSNSPKDLNSLYFAYPFLIFSA